MPVYNERATLRTVVERVLAVPDMNLELIAWMTAPKTNPGTSWPTSKSNIRSSCLSAAKKHGQGRGLTTRHPEATGEFVLIQDADLEYDPCDYPLLLDPLIQNKADVVYGSRFLGAAPHRVLYFWHSVGNKLLTLISNCLTNINLTDMETCYKAFRREVIQSIPLEEHRFGFEPEITVKVAKRHLRIYEVGISYWGRTYEEGKKIGWKDGVRALWVMLKYAIKEPVTWPEQLPRTQEHLAAAIREDSVHAGN